MELNLAKKEHKDKLFPTRKFKQINGMGLIYLKWFGYPALFEN